MPLYVRFSRQHIEDMGYSRVPADLAEKRGDVIVLHGGGIPRPEKIWGVITRKHVAESVVRRAKVYPA